MTLNIVRLSAGQWKTMELSEKDYKKTPKQFRFSRVDGYFDHVDKDLENSFMNNEGYVFSRTLSVEELKSGYLHAHIQFYQLRVNEANSDKQYFEELLEKLE
ncbi:hypothetical protein RND61_14630 [Streptomyces sp. TRM76323]|uniref:Uncharacterized protein n=1 Tax=Streptomyces tamarix TaxID=3078565 RepID=A0ABU3QKK3_9ACTN|nr:hypothetical protein [Streptomyces tamarix]MDT9683298.1 hypothetical protein [Streptomyces tamarix]